MVYTISIIGIDGSGKTSLTNNLTNKLIKNNNSVGIIGNDIIIKSEDNKYILENNFNYKNFNKKGFNFLKGFKNVLKVKKKVEYYNILKKIII